MKLKIRKSYLAWSWTCYECVNWPGHIHPTWGEALMMGLDHIELVHPKTDWSFAESGFRDE